MKSHRDQGKTRAGILVIVAMTVMSGLGCHPSFRHRIYVDFDSPPGVHAGAAVLMNGAEIGRTATPVLPEEGQPKIRVPVSLERSIDSLPSGTIFRVKSAAGASILVAEPRGDLALTVSRKAPLVFPGAATDLEYVGLRARQFFDSLMK